MAMQSSCGSPSSAPPQCRRPSLGAAASRCSSGSCSSLRALRPRQPPPRLQRRVAAVASGLAGDGAREDEAPTAASDAALAVSAAWPGLTSPYDREIFLLAVPALFRCERLEQ